VRIVFAYNQHRGHAGGGDKYASDTVELARELGHEVTVFTKSSEALPKNIWGRLQAAASILAAPRSVSEFSALLDAFSPDVVHAFELFPLVSPYILPECRARGLPVILGIIDYRLTCPVVTHFRDGQVCTACCGGNERWAVLRNCRDNVPESISVAAYNTLVRRRGLVSTNVTHYDVPSDFSRGFFMEQLGIPADRISARNPLIDLPPQPVDDPSSGEYIAFAGRFTEEKGVQIAVEAARISGLPVRLARHRKGLRTVPVPPGMEVITDTRDDLMRFYRGARMVIVPSVWFETFCVVGAEGMGLGLPVIVSRIGAVGDLVEDGVDGLHFTPGDPADLARKMGSVWHDASLCRRLGKAAREKAARTWGRDNARRVLSEVYRTVMQPVS
jgi:glycosyltransferase involved in cell wall biosynthesis